MLKTLRGSIPYNSDSEDLGFIERLVPGCFDKSLASGRDVLARVEHDSRLLLGRRSSGTLKLTSDRHGLHYTIDVPDTVVGRDTALLCERGDLRASSFAFSVPDEKGERWSIGPDGRLRRDLVNAVLHDVAPVSDGAYPAASVMARTDDTETVQQAAARMHINQLRLRLASS